MFKKFILFASLALLATDVLSKEGPNDCQQAPVLTLAVNNNGKITVTGTLKTKHKKTKCIIQFFGNPTQRDSITEGADFLGQKTIMTNDKGCKSFTAHLPPTQNTDPFISATATVIDCGNPGNTSQFSASIPVTFVN